jgi:hypothetical protein
VHVVGLYMDGLIFGDAYIQRFTVFYVEIANKSTCAPNLGFIT